MKHETIAILDFGSQFSQLICRRIRELNVYAELFPNDVTSEELFSHNIKGIILSGGPSSVYEQDSPKLHHSITPSLHHSITPIFGICYGMQLLVSELGGKVATSDKREYGFAEIEIESVSGIFSSLEKKQNVWMSHGDEVEELPNGFSKIASSVNCNFAAMENAEKKIFGVQFHPEVEHTQNGKTILKNFIFDICKCKGDWSTKSFIDESVEVIRKKVGKEKVLLGLSGGVDSSVTAALLHKAIGEQLTCVFVDNGLLRKNEFESVQQTFSSYPHFNLVAVDAKEKFLSVLKGIINPEEKRKLIGKTFIEVFEETIHSSVVARSEATKQSPKHQKIASLPLAMTNSSYKYLAQGTLYPDVIESAHPERKKAQTIKTHHNVGGLPKDLKFELIEPLRYLFKDEVREVGLQLGLPKEIVFRHPFPGPGLAVRIIGDITEEKLHLLREADTIFIEELRNVNLYEKVWQAFAVLTSVQSVGVMGDGRTYDYLVVLRAVTSNDGMTADWAKLPNELLAKVSSRIVNEVRGVNRVAYDITSKPPATIEWE
ncbi:MAG: glutamine-hydrolyzing GMP synthase [Ignavibacteriales bacterium]|nr:glutamine-hydrolyzing GMP synthase [Ignavibacteriales bacterium]